MLPEVEQFIRTWDQAVVDEHATANLANSFIARQQVIEDRRQTQKNAWSELNKSTHPLVRWIVQYVPYGYVEEAQEVLKLLPATLPELDLLASQLRWCEEWGNFRARAVAAGVVNTEFDIEMQVNGGPWYRYEPLERFGTGLIARGMLHQMFVNGVNLVQFDTGLANVKVRPVVTRAIPRHTGD